MVAAKRAVELSKPKDKKVIVTEAKPRRHEKLPSLMSVTINKTAPIYNDLALRSFVQSKPVRKLFGRKSKSLSADKSVVISSI